MTIKRPYGCHHVVAAILPMLSAAILSVCISSEASAQQQVIYVPPPIVCGEGTYAVNNGCMDLTPPSIVAVAYHPDANDIWVAAQYPTKASARIAAMDPCGAAMGQGCEWTWQGRGVLVVARGADGQILWATHGKKSEALKMLADQCKLYELGCTQIGTFKHDDEFRGRNRTAPDNVRMPKDMQNLRKRYAAAAWITGNGQSNKFWVASGRSTRKEAQDDAVALCQIQSNENPNCAVVASTGDGVMLSFNKGASQSVIVEQSEARARQAVAQQCRREQLACTVHAVFDARQDGVFEKAFP